MKKIVLTTVLALFCINLLAQQETPEEMERVKPTRGESPVLYVSTSTGINNATGPLGFNFDLPVAKYVSLDAGAGLSTWGSKLYLGGKYYLRPFHRGIAFSMGITHNTGVNEFKRDMETVYNTRETVTLHLYAQTNILFAVYRYFNLGRKYNRFYTGFGWSVDVSGKSWTETAGHTLTDDSRYRINSMIPGGPVATVGFSFGMTRR